MSFIKKTVIGIPKNLVVVYVTKPLSGWYYWNISTISTAVISLSPVKTRGYRVELVRLSVCPSVRPSVCLSVCLSVPLDIGYFVHASLV